MPSPRRVGPRARERLTKQERPWGWRLRPTPRGSERASTALRLHNVSLLAPRERNGAILLVCIGRGSPVVSSARHPSPPQARCHRSKSGANFLELQSGNPTSENPQKAKLRIHIPRTLVNKGMKKGRNLREAPARSPTKSIYYPNSRLLIRKALRTLYPLFAGHLLAVYPCPAGLGGEDGSLTGSPTSSSQRSSAPAGPSINRICPSVFLCW